MRLRIQVDVPEERHPYIAAKAVLEQCIKLIDHLEHDADLGNPPVAIGTLHHTDGTECGGLLFVAKPESNPQEN